ncbi:UNVERIFIED_CONTAM: hypothetical protein Sindi_1852800, partial [Sesamum indicum]
MVIISHVPMQSKQIERMVSSMKRICPLSKHDRGISDAFGDAFMFYKPVVIGIGRIANPVLMSSNLG